MENVLRVKLAETEYERQETKKLVAYKYTKEFGTNPPLAKKQVIVTRKESIIGTVGVEFDVRGKFPLEEYFDVYDNRFKNARKNDFVEFTRWASLDPSAGHIALFGATLYALKRGKQYAIFCAKDKHLQYVRVFGATYSILSAMMTQHILNPSLENHATPPHLQVAMADIRSWRDVFLKAVIKARSNGAYIKFTL